MTHILAAIGVVLAIWFAVAFPLGVLVGRRLRRNQPTDSNDNTNGGSR